MNYQQLHEEATEIINNYRQALEILQITITGIRCSSTLEQAQSFAYEAQKSISLCNILNEEISATNEAPAHQGVGYHAEGSDAERCGQLL